MATLVLTDAFISIDSNDVSADGNQVSISYEAESVDETAFGDSTRINKGGLKNWSMDITFNQDFAASQLDSILFPLVGTTVAVAVRPTSASVGTGNPSYNGTGLIQSYAPLGNSVGDLATASLNITCAGDLSRSTS